MRLPNLRDHSDTIDCPLVYTFKLVDSGFTPITELALGALLVSSFSSHIYTCVRDFDCWADPCKKKIRLPLYYSSVLCMFHHNSCCIFSCYISLIAPSVRCLYSCCYVTRLVQWLRLAVSEGHTTVDVSLPSPWGRKHILFPKRFIL
jgi:hypothetical protein